MSNRDAIAAIPNVPMHTLKVDGEVLGHLIAADLKWAKQHIIESGNDYDDDVKRRKALLKALDLVIRYYGG